MDGARRDLQQAWGLAAALLSLGAAGCGSAYRSGPQGPVTSAAVVDVPPDRPRFVYQAPPQLLKLHASRVELSLVDMRKTERSDSPQDPVLADTTPPEPIEVSLHRAFVSTLQQRLTELADGAPSAPAITLTLEVQHVLVWKGEQRREIGASFALGLATSAGTRVAGLHGNAAYTVTGAPYDLAELDELHLGTCLQAFDAALTQEAIQSANAVLQAEPVANASSDRT